MRILQFAFDGKSDNLYLPHNYDANTVVYTGTHDNDTTPGWWRSLAAHEQAHIRRYLGVSAEGDMHWSLIHAASASVATLCVIPMQDVLGLDSAHRMNMPGQGDGFWEWRFNWGQVAPWHAERLLELARLHGRAARFATASGLIGRRSGRFADSPDRRNRFGNVAFPDMAMQDGAQMMMASGEHHDTLLFQLRSPVSSERQGGVLHFEGLENLA